MAKLFIIYLLSSFTYAKIITPNDLDSLNTLHVLIEWEQNPNTEKYNLQIASSNDFSSILVDTTTDIPLFICKDNLTWNSQYFVRAQSVINKIPQLDFYDTTRFYTLNREYTDVGDINTSTNIEPEYFDGITILGLFNHHQTIGFDKDGNEIWNTGEQNNFFMTTIDDYGNLYGFKKEVSLDKPLKFNFKMDILWKSTDHGDRHEFRQIMQNNYMYMEPKYQFGIIPIGSWTDNFIQMGYFADGLTQEFNWKAQQISLKDHSNQKIWEWNPFEHFSLDDFDLYGTWYEAIHNGEYDWTHSNSFWYSDIESAIYLSSRHLSRITKIDYPSGEIIWNMGPNSIHNLGDNNICEDIGFSFQHHIQELNDGSFILFDNGNRSTVFRSTDVNESRILRFKIDSLNCEIIWEYILPGNSYSNSMSGVVLLGNGNYLIATRSDGGKVIEVNNAKDIVWEANLNRELHDQTPGIYRAFRVPSLYPHAYSVVFDDLEYFSDKKKGVVIDHSDNLKISIYNKSGIGQEYSYSLSDSLGYEPYNETGNIYISKNEKAILSFKKHSGFKSRTISNNLIFEIYPSEHSYAHKSYKLELLLLPENKNDSQILTTYPNPTNSIAIIKLYMPKKQKVILQVFNILGEKIEQSKDKFLDKGINYLKWDPKGNTSGVYFFRILTESSILIDKVILTK